MIKLSKNCFLMHYLLNVRDNKLKLNKSNFTCSCNNTEKLEIYAKWQYH